MELNLSKNGISCVDPGTTDTIKVTRSNGRNVRVHGRLLCAQFFRKALKTKSKIGHFGYFSRFSANDY